MMLRGFGVPVVCALALASCVLFVQSCGHSVTGPGVPAGRLVVFVSQSGSIPESGKTIEIVGTSQTQVTDASGLAEFTIAAGSYVVRAYGINTPGPPPAFVEQGVVVTSGQTSRLEFFDCTECVAAR